MSFIMNHMLLSKQEYRANQEEGLYDAGPVGLEIVEDVSPNPGKIRAYIKKIDEASKERPLRWSFRQQYATDVAVQIILDKPNVHLFILQKGESDIGYCLMHEEALDLSAQFKGKAANQNNAKIMRIEGFGLFGDERYHGQGAYFLQQMLAYIFEQQQADYAYLTSRGTNHPKVVPFYQQNGFQLIGHERKPPEQEVENPDPIPLCYSL